MRENLHQPRVTPILRGVHHLALCTDDMKATIDFYVDVLGMPLVHAMKVPPGLGIGPGNRGNPPYERVRHYFFDMGNDSLLDRRRAGRSHGGAVPGRSWTAAGRLSRMGPRRCQWAFLAARYCSFFEVMECPTDL
jgi:catechol 2,3-dioxygenase-like lactoylglutathione lyase family enzyme